MNAENSLFSVAETYLQMQKPAPVVRPNWVPSSITEEHVADFVKAVIEARVNKKNIVEFNEKKYLIREEDPEQQGKELSKTAADIDHEGEESKEIKHDNVTAKQTVGDTIQNKPEEVKEEELVGNQHKLDVNDNGKIDADDLAKLRAGEVKEEEEAVIQAANVEDKKTQRDPQDTLPAMAEDTDSEKDEDDDSDEDATDYEGDDEDDDESDDDEADWEKYDGDNDEDDQVDDEPKDQNPGEGEDYYDEEMREGLEEALTATGKGSKYAHPAWKGHKPIRWHQNDNTGEYHLAHDVKSILHGITYKKGTTKTDWRADHPTDPKQHAAAQARVKAHGPAGYIGGYKRPDEETPHDKYLVRTGYKGAYIDEGNLEEKLTAKDPAGKWIHDFVKSKNPKFAGKSKEQRKKMALGAFYSAQREATEYQPGLKSLISVADAYKQMYAEGTHNDAKAGPEVMDKGTAKMKAGHASVKVEDRFNVGAAQDGSEKVMPSDKPAVDAKAGSETPKEPTPELETPKNSETGSEKVDKTSLPPTSDPKVTFPNPVIQNPTGAEKISQAPYNKTH